MLAIRDEILTSGHKCSIIATSRSSSSKNEPYVFHPHSAWELIKHLISMRFDILHLHVGGDVSRRVLLLVIVSAIFGRGKSVLTLHSGAYPLTKEGRTARPTSIRGLIFRRFSQIIAVNGQLADVFRRYGVAETRTTTIPPFSLKKPDKNVSVPDDIKDFCAKYSPLLLAVGGLESDYDPLFQIGAMGEILSKFPSAGLLIVGDGSMRDEAERAVMASDHADHIRVCGDVEHAITLHLIEDADVLIRTTLFDGDAISVREAIFLGTPVVATDNGMRPDGVLLIAAGDIDGFIASIGTALTNGRLKTYEVPENNPNIRAVVDIYESIAKV